MQVLMPLMAKFQQYAPHFTGPASPPEAVSNVLKVIENSTMEDAGAFLSHHGNKEWL